MTDTSRSLPPEPAPSDLVPIGLALGDQATSTIAAAIDAAGGLSWLRDLAGEVVVATGDVEPRGTGRLAARAVAEIVEGRDGRARLVAPERLPFGAIPLFGDRERWQEIDLSGSGARLERLPVRRELAGAAALVGAGSLGRPDEPGPLALGLWLRHVQPKFAIAARLAGERAPIVADLAAAFRPRLSVLSGGWGSLIAAAASPDLVAAELAGLALSRGAVERPEERPNPWEDPLVQRATELGLGVLHPSQLDLRPIWAGPVGSPAAEALLTLGDLVADALGIL